MKKTLLSALSIALLASCSNSDKNKTNNSNSDSLSKPQSSITPPVEGVNNPSETFSIANANGCVTKSKRGTFLIVPPNAFVNKDGSQITGEVEVKLTEIFTPSEIIVSGIPMNVSDKGTIKPFISDGMFDIKATCNNQEVAIADGKAITVCNQSNKNDKDFDYWYFNQTTGQWDNIGDRTETVDEASILRKAQEVNPEQLKVYKSLTLNTKETQNPLRKTIDLKNEKKSGSSNFMFTLDANYDEYPELKHYKNILWRPAGFLSEQDEQKFKEELAKSGTNVILERENPKSTVYDLSYGRDKSMKVIPVLFGKDKDAQKQSLSSADKAYNKDYDQYKSEQAKIAATYSVDMATYNTFSVMKLGVYNCDRFYNSQDNDQVIFTLNNEEVDKKVYVVLDNNQGVIQLSEAYMKDGAFELPIDIIKCALHIGRQGNIYATDLGNKTQKGFNYQLKDMASNVKSSGELESIINSF